MTIIDKNSGGKSGGGSSKSEDTPIYNKVEIKENAPSGTNSVAVTAPHIVQYLSLIHISEPTRPY